MVSSIVVLIGCAASWVALMDTAPTPEPFAISLNDSSRMIEVQAHRGGLGMRSEESLWAYAYALEIGVDTLEMDMLWTKDEIPVIWHDHIILGTKCSGQYVGQYIANLTLAEIKTLNCAKQIAGHPQAELHDPTRIATLEEVLDLITCFGDEGVTINLETKLDPENSNQTFPVDKYINDLWPFIESKGFGHRTTIQSFDWRTLVGIKAKWPKVVTIALLDDMSIAPNSKGIYPWLGGVNLTDFKGDWVAAAKSIGAGAVSPIHGVPGNATPNTPGYVPFVTKDVVQRSHEADMAVIPWTTDYEVTIGKMIDDGVDALIGNYPERIMWVAKQKGLSVGRARNPRKPQCLSKADQ